ncbi:MAG TPA: Uma2 family endonuclease [Kofleriaceae bacterium]
MDRERVPPVPFDWDRDRDQVVVLHGVTWPHYVALSDARGESSRPLFAYLDGDLEIVTTSRGHEFIKTLLARLVETYAEEMNLRLNGLGETTWRNKARRAGLEADECYTVRKKRKVPDLAIEVVLTSGGVDKLEIYRRLGVREVWFWINARVYVYRLNGKYKEVQASVALPGIDLDALARIIAVADEDEQTEAVRAYRKSLRKRA